MTDDEVREREIRQVLLMLDRLDRLRTGAVGLGGVINDLEALEAELLLVDESWRKRFWQGWGNLEVPYAVALDRMEPIPTVVDPTVARGFDALEQLVRKHLVFLGQ